MEQRGRAIFGKPYPPWEPPPPGATNSPKVWILPDWRATFGRFQKHTKMGIFKNLPKSNKSNSWAPVASI